MSISVNGQTFHLRTKNTSYIMDVYKGYATFVLRQQTGRRLLPSIL